MFPKVSTSNLNFTSAALGLRWQAIALWFFVNLVCYFGFRIVFFSLNMRESFVLTQSDVLLAFLHGFRFDISTIFLLGLPGFVLIYLGLKSSFWNSSRGFFCLLGLVPSIILNVLDAEYFKFSGKRAGLDVLAFRNDAWEQSRQLLGQYWYLMVIILLLICWAFLGLHKVEAKLNSSDAKPNKKRPALKQFYVEVTSFCFLVVIVFLGIRGGTQRKPLDLINAYTFENNQLNLLVLNSAFTVAKSNAVGKLPEVSFYASQIEAHEALKKSDKHLQLSGNTSFKINVTNAFPNSQKMNVVLVIFESLAREYMAYGNGTAGYTPFVDSLIPKSLFFEQAFANGRRSIDAAWSIGAGIPALMDEPYPTGPYKGNKIWGLGKLFGLNGYKSWFFHGGKNGTMWFDFFANRAGYDHYYGLNEYPSERQGPDFDGSWGVFDEPFLLNMIEVLKTSSKPFFSTVFTLSSHNPYPVPEAYKAKFGAIGTHPMHASIRYADHALQRFFEQASLQDWYKNTLFVITGDHTSISEDVRYQNDLGYYRVPIILFSPSMSFSPRISKKIVEHADLSCSIANFVGLLKSEDVVEAAKISPFCDDIMLDQQGQVVLQSSGFYTVVSPNYWLRRSEDDQKKVFPTSYPGGFELFEKPIENKNIEDALQNKLRAAQQLFQNGLNTDDFYLNLKDWKQ